MTSDLISTLGIIIFVDVFPEEPHRVLQCSEQYKHGCHVCQVSENGAELKFAIA